MIQNILLLGTAKPLLTELRPGQKPLKARTHRPIFSGFAAESAVESADSIPELADSTTDSVRVGRLSMFNMFNIRNPLESADYWSRLTGNWPSGYGPI